MARPIVTLEGLKQAAARRQAVYVPSSPCWFRPRPAAFVINQQGAVLLRLIKAGMFIYKKEEIKNGRNNITS